MELGRFPDLGQRQARCPRAFEALASRSPDLLKLSLGALYLGLSPPHVRKGFLLRSGHFASLSQHVVRGFSCQGSDEAQSESLLR